MPPFSMWLDILAAIAAAGSGALLSICAINALKYRIAMRKTLSETIVEKTKRLRMLEDAIVRYLETIERLREIVRVKNARIKRLQDALRDEQIMRKEAERAANILHAMKHQPDGEYMFRIVNGQAGNPVD
jgi:hypothetical protein